jgi:hypothetical protein
MTPVQDSARSHGDAIELIPWLVNGRLPASDVAWLERHVQQCEVCRNEVAAQRALRQAVRQDASNIEYAPHAALQKLWARIDQPDVATAFVESSVERSPSVSSSPVRESVRSLTARWRVAAGVILVVGVGLFAAVSRGIYVPGFAPEYRTATANGVVPDRAGQIRAVFSPTLTVDDLTRIVSTANLKIIDGPSAAGVYTLAMQSGQGQSMADVLARMRSDPRVRFAEPVVAESRGPP